MGDEYTSSFSLSSSDSSSNASSFGFDVIAPKSPILCFLRSSIVLSGKNKEPENV